jgi:hypothetical protein
MSAPTFENSKVKFEKHLRCLMNQCFIEFQEDFEVKITSITIELKDSEQISIINNIKINL